MGELDLDLWVERLGMGYIGVLMGSMTDHTMGAGHPKERVAELDSQSALCPDAWGKPG